MGYERQWCNELKFLNSNFFPVLFVCICKCRCWSTCLCLHFLSWNARFTSSYKHGYFCTVTTSCFSSAFPIFKSCLSKGFFFTTKFTWNEIKWNLFFFLFRTIICHISHSNVLVHSNFNNDKISKIYDIFSKAYDGILSQRICNFSVN